MRSIQVYNAIRTECGQDAFTPATLANGFMVLERVGRPVCGAEDLDLEALEEPAR